MRIFTEQALKAYSVDSVGNQHYVFNIKGNKYNWAVARVEELLPLVTDDTPLAAPESIELQLLSNLVADYSDEHFSIGDLPEEPSTRIATYFPQKQGTPDRMGR